MRLCDLYVVEQERDREISASASWSEINRVHFNLNFFRKYSTVKPHLEHIARGPISYP